jgi:hypothetical protein
MPNLVGERALQQQMMDGFKNLVTEVASGVVWKSSSHQAVSSPAWLLICEQWKILTLGGAQVSPYELPGVTGGRALEGCEVAGLGCVDAIGSLSSALLILLLSENGVLSHLPEQQILANFMYPKDALYVSCPMISL